jgi:DNA-binding transcriptional MerR regulator
VASCWRIDELAQRAGVTVDTIRYYAREHLLPPPERSGRHKLYSPAHLERLLRIRDLQGKRFSLAAIRAVLTADRPGLEQLFATDEARQYSFDQLVAESDVERGVAEGLRDVGLLPDPREFGHEAYDDVDLDMLRAVAELQGIGMTPELLVELAAIYVRHFRALQHDVHELLAGRTRDDWNTEELVSLQRRLSANSSRMITATDLVLNYLHQRTIQRLTLEALRTAEETRTGIGGVRIDGSD